MSHYGSKLEIEDEENRQQRIYSLLEQLNSSSSSPSKNTSNAAPPTFDFGERKTYAVDPPSELLARIQDFLPRLKEENDSLSQRIRDNPSSVDIENIEEDTEQYIEMNLGLGVLETRLRDSDSHLDDEDSESEDSLSSSSSPSSDSSSSESESESESDGSHSDSSSDSDSSSIGIKAISSRPLKPLPRRTAQFDIGMLPDPPSAGQTPR
ncbi:uncharacterized protein F5891DRAFT_1124842 [Suillus fuscotomentosus]|uniref:Uncharacterized protein n=1 Tax=Suillus fuscotomentosus TaxID=1912939 RepID=A0AAD4EIR8_9AGAM|nr:uncharacterized protein F5891DRAFT_1124842 [Suillus fuscotomentosus]KAG1906857.1 hypothetical protein F5891DRAFT_1124842 [Suillus fuscotomentosus]